MLRSLSARALVRVRGLAPGVQELASFGRLSPADARRAMAERLAEQIRYFGSRADALPEWRAAARVSDPEGIWKLWPSLPILTKEDLRERFCPHVMQERFRLRGEIGSTGGSTGEPTRYLHDRRMIRAKPVASLHCRQQLGWYPGLPTICLWGSERDVGHAHSLRGRISMLAQNIHVVDGYMLNRQTVDRVLELMARHDEVAVYGFTSMLEFLAQEVLNRGITVPTRVRTAWNGGEMLSRMQSDLFARAFGVPILNFYGSRDLSSMAYQPGTDRSLRIVRPYQFLEIVDENGCHVGPGESGRLVWTNTVNRGTPFLRYDNGDMGTYVPEDCDQSGLHSLSRLDGRSAGVFTLPGGRTINGLFWNHLFKDYPEIRRFQVAIVDDSAVHIRLVGAGFTPNRERHLRDVLLRFLGSVGVQVDWLSELPRTPQGKLVQVVRERSGGDLSQDLSCATPGVLCNSSR